MLDNLQNVDLSGLATNIRYDSADFVMPQLMNSFAMLLIAVGFLALLYWFFSVAFSVPKSKKYRELLSDMYVVGRIRQEAEKDKVDLVQELKVFNKILKKEKLRHKGLDEVIEAELKEKLAEVQEKEDKK